MGFEPMYYEETPEEERLTYKLRKFVRRIRQKIKSRIRQGQAFETMTRTALKRLADNPKNKLWFTRLWDFRSFIRLNPKFHVCKQPADFLVCYNGQFIFIECKSSQANRFDPKNVKPHQEQAMLDTERAGGIYWLLIFHRGASPSEHRLFALRPKDWFYLQSHDNEGFKTYTWKQIEEQGKELHRRNGVWDFTPLLISKCDDCSEINEPPDREEDMR